MIGESLISLTLEKNEQSFFGWQASVLNIHLRATPSLVVGSGGLTPKATEVIS